MVSQKTLSNEHAMAIASHHSSEILLSLFEASKVPKTVGPDDCSPIVTKCLLCLKVN